MTAQNFKADDILRVLDIVRANRDSDPEKPMIREETCESAIAL